MKDKVYNRAETVSSVLSTASEWHAFFLGFASWILTSTYLPGGRIFIIGIALVAEGATLGRTCFRKLGGEIVDPKAIPKDIRKEPHYFIGGITLAAVLLAAASVFL